jgi:chromosome segregation ATPase
MAGAAMTEPESEAKGLDAAIADLEREVDAKVATLRRDAAEHVAKLETELAGLRTDQEQMARNLKLSETQSRDLRAVAQTAGARIDHAIAGIKSVLADGG